MRSALPLAAITIAAALLLSGCVPQDPEVIPPPEPSTEPIFASDEEALAAATEAYKAYLAMSDLIAQEGGVNPERIAPYVTEEWLGQEVAAFKELFDSGNHQTGNITMSVAQLQAHSSDVDGVGSVAAYFCLDFSASEVVTAEGAAVTPLSRPEYVTVEVHFGNSVVEPELVVEGIEPWQSSGIC